MKPGQRVERPDVAEGFGPWWFRIALIAISIVYFGLLLRPPALTGAARTIAFFSESTALFPNKDDYATEFRLEAWSCAQRAWVPMDMRPYFPMRADDKEGRFQRFVYFYQRRKRETAAETTVRRAAWDALDDYLTAGHAAGDRDDAVSGPIGGIRVFEQRRAIPELGTTIARYEFHPLDPVPPEERVNKYISSTTQRSQRCGQAVSEPAASVGEAPAVDSP